MAKLYYKCCAHHNKVWLGSAVEGYWYAVGEGVVESLQQHEGVVVDICVCDSCLTDPH